MTKLLHTSNKASGSLKLPIGWTATFAKQHLARITLADTLLTEARTAEVMLGGMPPLSQTSGFGVRDQAPSIDGEGWPTQRGWDLKVSSERACNYLVEQHDRWLHPQFVEKKSGARLAYGYHGKNLSTRKYLRFKALTFRLRQEEKSPIEEHISNIYLLVRSRIKLCRF